MKTNEYINIDEFSSEYSSTPFSSLRLLIEKEEKERDKEYKENVLSYYFEKLNNYRMDGLFKIREVEENIDSIKQQHYFDLLTIKTNYSTDRKKMNREKKRRKVELVFQIKDKEKEYSESLNKVNRDTKNALLKLSLLKKNNGIIEENIYGFLKKFESIYEGYQTLSRILSKNDNDVNDYDSQIKESENEYKSLKDLSEKKEKYLNLINLKVRKNDCVYETKNETKLIKQYDEINAIEQSITIFEYYKRLIILCKKVYLYSQYSNVEHLKYFNSLYKKIIDIEAKQDAIALSNSYEANLEKEKTNEEYFSKLKELDNELEEAKRVKKENRQKEVEYEKKVYDYASKHYDDLIKKAKNKQKEEIISAKNLLNNIEDKNQKGKVEDYAYRSISIASIRPKVLKDLKKVTMDEIYSKIHKVDRFKEDRNIKLYYSKEEIINDPSLIDTSSVRLVINVKKKDEKNIKKVEKGDKIKHIIGNTFLYLFLIVAGLVVIFPFYWMINTSLKSTEEIRNSLTPTFWPQTIKWSNYGPELFAKFDFGNYLINTLVVGVFSTLGVLITSILAAFAFARLKFKGRDTLFMTFLMTMMIPGEMMILTNYITVANFGWVSINASRFDAYLAMIMPFLTSVLYMYLLRQSFKQVPEELYLAAKVDGKTDWQFLWNVMVPLNKPTLITIGILELIGTWNAYVWPNLVASKQEYRLISNGLRSSFVSITGVEDTGLQMAAAVLVNVPLLILFIIFRKYIMKGVGRAGIKG